MTTPVSVAFPTETPDRAWRAVWILFVMCSLFRIVDVLLFRSDEWLGEQVLTKMFGLIVVVSYL
jgi:hypothetical protein